MCGLELTAYMRACRITKGKGGKKGSSGGGSGGGNAFSGAGGQASGGNVYGNDGISILNFGSGT